MSPAEYLSTIGRAYLAAPPLTIDEYLLEQALHVACKRYGVEPESLLERMVAVAPVDPVVHHVTFG